MRCLAFLLISLDLIKARESGDCGVKGDQLQCCDNYMLKNGTCIECPPGKFGESCSENCPDGYYGKFCTSKCTCSEGDICHYEKGCIHSPERSKANYDDCLQNEPRMGNRSCCVNERTVGNQCQECWRGRYGKDCKYPCPIRRYGRFCLGTCNCTMNEICNRETGCIDTTDATTSKSPDVDHENTTGSFADMKQGLSEKSFLIVIMGVSIGIIVTGIVGIVVLKRLTMFRCGETVSKEHKDKRLPSRDELTATALSSTTITDHRENPAVKVSNEPRLTSTKSRTLGPSTYSTLQNPSSSQDLKNTNKQKRPMLILEESCTHRMNGKASTLPISGLKETRVPFNIQDRRPREDYLEEMQSEILKPEGGILTFETDVESKKYNRSKYTIDNEIRVNCELHDFVSTKNETPKTSDDLNSNRYSLVKRM